MTDLTQDWKDGKLKEGLYYVQFPRGDVLRCKLSEVDKFFSANIKILAEVPDYNLWMNLWNTADMVHKANNKLLEYVERLEKENKELKERIKELENTENEQQNNLCTTREQLTERWEKGERAMKLMDKEKTAEILKRINIMTAGNIADNFVKINEFRLGSAYSGFSEQRMDCFAISPNAGNKTICYEIKVSRGDFRNDIKKEDKQTPARCFSNQFYYCTPKGLLKKEEVPVWAGLIEFDLDDKIEKDCWNCYNVKCVYIKIAPLFDKCQPTWGMVVSAYRNGLNTVKKEQLDEI